MWSMANSGGLRAVLGWSVVVAGVVAGCGRTPLGQGSRSEASGGSENVGGNNPGGNSPGGNNPGGNNPGGNNPGGGGNTGCVVDADCDDADICTVNRCIGGFCDSQLLDADNDGQVSDACGGPDCNDLNPNVFVGATEQCSDAADNDCNGVADCFDPVCANVPNCGCIPNPQGELCTNNQDDDCDTTVDCNDTDCINTEACGCLASEVGLCGDGFDNDCDNQFDCDDPDCFAEALCQCQATPENCTNGQDEDCDLLIDCADPDCAGTSACTCVPPGTPEVCNDNQDNDCDLLVDCADPNCAVSMFCQNCMPEVCNDNLDNDCDNLIDCADDACAFAPNCAPTPELCNNDLDDDNDSLIDCDDPDCSNNPICVLAQQNCLTAKLIPGSGTYTGTTEGNIGSNIGACGGGAGEAVFFFVLTEPSFVQLDSIGTSFDSVIYVRKGECEGGVEIGCDDDSANSANAAFIEFPILYPGVYYVFLDGFTIDPNFGANDGPFVLNAQIVPSPSEICGDQIDNDGDIYVDCADPDCTNLGSCINCQMGNPPTAEFGIAACTDGIDNDCDGDIDCADSDCSASPYALTECCNGMDQNDNNIPDDFACRCNSDADCGGGQLCYTSTTFTCGIPCQNFFGNVCPAVAPGSSCNLATSQCEFP